MSRCFIPTLSGSVGTQLFWKFIFDSTPGWPAVEVEGVSLDIFGCHAYLA
ncbi:MAG: hypothetical protein AB7O52_16045 [Planctomycetota bacterium]